MHKLPPGPGKLAMVRMLFDLSRSVADYANEYGDPWTLRTAFGPMVVAVSPEHNKTIFTADPNTFVPAAGEVFRIVLGNSVLLQAGAEHRRSRKLLTPPFHGARMRAYGNLIRETALRWTAKWEVGKPFVMIETAQAITLDVIIEAVFGVNGSERVQEFRREILALLGSFSPLIFLRAFRHRFLGVGPWAKFQRHYAALQALVFALIAEHRQSLAGREDILSLLIAARDDEGQGLTDKDIMDQLLTIVFAGHETTAVMLAWIFYLLHKNPEALAKLRAELDPYDDKTEPETITRLPLLEAVCNEAMRLYPPVHLISRKLVRPLTLGGYELEPGVAVAAGAQATHRLASIYPNPDRFLPERFLEKTFTPFEFLPWGGGTRRCLGAAFAMYEMKLVVFSILKHHRLRGLETGEIKLSHRPGTIGPKSGIRMLLEQRLSG